MEGAICIIESSKGFQSAVLRGAVRGPHWAFFLSTHQDVCDAQDTQGRGKVMLRIRVAGSTELQNMVRYSPIESVSP